MRKIVKGSLDDKFLRAIFDPSPEQVAAQAAKVAEADARAAAAEERAAVFLAAAAARAFEDAKAVEDARAAAWVAQAAAASARGARAWFRERFENALAALEVEGFLSHAERMVLRTQHAAADAALRHMAPAVAHDYEANMAAEQVIADLVADWINGDLQAAKPALS